MRLGLQQPQTKVSSNDDDDHQRDVQPDYNVDHDHQRHVQPDQDVDNIDDQDDHYDHDNCHHQQRCQVAPHGGRWCGGAGGRDDPRGRQHQHHDHHHNHGDHQQEQHFDHQLPLFSIITLITIIKLIIIIRARFRLAPPLHPMRLPNFASPYSQQVAERLVHEVMMTMRSLHPRTIMMMRKKMRLMMMTMLTRRSYSSAECSQLMTEPDQLGEPLVSDKIMQVADHFQHSDKSDHHH